MSDCLERKTAPLHYIECRGKSTKNVWQLQWEFATQNYGADVTCRRSISVLVCLSRHTYAKIVQTL